MNYKKGLIKKNLKWLVGQEWYLQRFDACPNYLQAIVIGELKKEKRKGVKGHFYSHIGFFENNTVDWYLNLPEIRRTGDWLIKEIRQNKNFITDLITLWQKDENNFTQYFNNNKFLDCSAYANSELIKYYKKIIELYRKCVSGTSLIDGFVFSFDEYKEKYLPKVPDFELAWLSAPIKSPFLVSEEEDLKKIALLAQKNNFKKSELFKNKKIADLISQHQKNYFWLKNNYTQAIVLDNQFFYKRLIDLQNQKNSASIEKKKRFKIIKNLGLTQEDSNLLNSLPYWAYWQDCRKKYSLWATHLLELIIVEISARTKINKNILKYSLPDEMAQIFEGKIKKDLTGRYPNCLFFERGSQFEFINGLAGKKIFDQIFSTTIQEITTIKGRVANPGLFKGEAVIVKSATEIGKVKPGKVLVAVMTRPDYVMGMKVAGAIVTDEGGVTSHAAIVSREMNIPCIIGTKIATKVLNDGDLVEVDATKGIVTILKKAKS